jgi:outer membrane protein assembly factor BamD
MSVLRLVAALAVVAAIAGGCAAKKDVMPVGTADADKFLFDKETEAAKDRKWLNAREYFRNVVDNYPQSAYRPDAKLALGDTYIGEHSTESLLLAANEFREFLTFYPTNPRADYAQLQLSKSFAEQMLAPERDQSATKDAIKEIEIFLQRFPNSALLPEARKLEREAKDRLSDSSYRVGFYYFRVKWYTGAIDRFKEVLKLDPAYSNRDAVYYHLAEALYLSSLKTEALPYYERLLSEFEKSQYLAAAQKRVAELKSS